MKCDRKEELGCTAQNYIIIVEVFLPIFLQISFFMGIDVQLNHH